MKKAILLGAFLMAGTTLSYAKNFNPISVKGTTEIVSNTVENANLPWYFVTTTVVTTYWLLGEPVLVTTTTTVRLAFVPA